MRHKIGTTNEECEVTNFYPSDKGTLRGKFTLVLHPHGQKILDCKYFVKGDQRWFAFPSKEIKRDDKSDWIPIVSYTNATYLEALKAAVLECLKTEGTANEKQPTNPFPRNPSFI